MEKSLRHGLALILGTKMPVSGTYQALEELRSGFGTAAGRM